MASLSIDIGTGGGDGTSPGMVAEIERLSRSGDRQRRTVSVWAGAPKRLDDIAPGTWEVRVVTAAGEVLTREIEVADGVLATADFTVGRRTARTDGADVPSARAPRSATKAISGRTFDDVGRGPAAPRGIVKGFGLRSFGGSGQIGRPLALGAEAEVEARVVVSAPAKDEGQILATWSALADALDAGRLPDSLWSAGMPAAVSSDRTRMAGGHLWSVQGHTGSRTYALARGRDGRRLHVMPVPWREHDEQPGAVLSVGASLGSGSGVVVEEPPYAGLLSYLSHGALVTATELISADDTLRSYADDGPVRLLREKRACPLGACAAGYALVGTAVPASSAPWHPWIGNLRNWFEWLPDGAILDARLRLLTARTEQEVVTIAEIVREALARGVPFYRQGFHWLLQSMLQFPDDDLLAAAHPLVARVAASLAVAEVFTTFEMERD